MTNLLTDSALFRAVRRSRYFLLGGATSQPRIVNDYAFERNRRAPLLRRSLHIVRGADAEEAPR